MPGQTAHRPDGGRESDHRLEKEARVFRDLVSQRWDEALENSGSNRRRRVADQLA
jgi:hypothetical protein